MNFRESKYALFMEVGNMQDINSMTMKDYMNLLDYLEYRSKKETGKPVPIRESQKEMIKKLKKTKE